MAPAWAQANVELLVQNVKEPTAVHPKAPTGPGVTWSWGGCTLMGGGLELTNTGPMLFQNIMEPTRKQIQVEPALAQSEMEPQ